MRHTQAGSEMKRSNHRKNECSKLFPFDRKGWMDSLCGSQDPRQVVFIWKANETVFTFRCNGILSVITLCNALGEVRVSAFIILPTDWGCILETVAPYSLCGTFDQSSALNRLSFWIQTETPTNCGNRCFQTRSHFTQMNKGYDICSVYLIAL